MHTGTAVRAVPSEQAAKRHAVNLHSLNTLRPNTLEQFVGQDHLKVLIKTSLAACIRSNRPFPHTLISGGVGLGKTTLAAIIARERGVNFLPVSPDQLADPDGVAKVLHPLRGDQPPERLDARVP